MSRNASLRPAAVLCLFVCVLTSAPQLCWAQALVPVQELYQALGDPRDVALDATGTHLYVADGRKVWAYSRNSDTGELTPIDSVIDGRDGDVPIAGVKGIDISPDGRHVYAAAETSGAIIILARNAVTGALTFVEALDNNDQGIDGLGGVRDIIVSPDDAHVYAVSDEGEREFLWTFLRNAQTGLLTPLDALIEGVAPVTGMNEAQRLLIDPLGVSVFVCGQSPGSLAVFDRDEATGLLTFREALFDGEDFNTEAPNALAIAPSGTSLYIAGDTAPSQTNSDLTVLQRDTDTRSLTLIQTIPDNSTTVLKGGGSLAISDDGARVIAPAALEDSFIVFARDPETGLLSVFETISNGTIEGGDFLLQPTALAFAPGGNQFYVASKGSNAINLFERNPFTQEAEVLQSQQEASGGLVGLDQPINMALSPDGRHAYLTAFASGRLLVLERDLRSGRLDRRLQQADGLVQPWDVLVSPDGNNVYVSQADGRAISVYDRDPQTGLLVEDQVIATPSNLRASGLNMPSNQYLYAILVGTLATSGYAVFDRDIETGLLDPGIETVTRAVITEVQYVPAGDFAYALLGPSISVLARSLDTGRITSITSGPADDIGGVDGLAGAESLTITPDGLNVYVAGFDDDAIAVFRRNLDTNALEFVEAQFDGGGEVEVLDAAIDVETVPNGSLVFATGFGDDGITVFTRDAQTGRLTFLEAATDGSGGANALDGARNITVAPDGSTVYVLAELDNAIQVFQADVPVRLTGRVLDEVSERGIGCASIEIASGDGAVREVAVTGENGDYFLQPVPAGEYNLRIFAPGFEDQSLPPVRLDSVEAIELDIQLSPLAENAGALSGRVTDNEGGQPLVGVLVEVEINDCRQPGAKQGGPGDTCLLTTYTCGDGNYEIELPNVALKQTLEAAITFSLPNYIDEVIPNAQLDPGAANTIDQGLTKSVVAAANVSGSVFEIFGESFEASSGARITLRGPTNISVDSSGEGLYSVNVVEGRYTVTASKAGFRQDVKARDVPGAAVIQVDLAIAPLAPEDLNGDSTLNAQDVQLVINAALKLSVPQDINADVNRDGAIDALDIQSVINAVLGLS